LIRRVALRALLLFVAVTSVLVLAGAVWAAPLRAAVSYSSQEIAFVKLLNEYRESKGLEPLLVSDELSEAGDRHCFDMGTYSFFDHYTQESKWFSSGASPWDRMAASGYDYVTTKGENIAAGYSTASAVFAGWKASSGHNANMLSAKFKVVGVSLVNVSGSPYGYYWTTDFGGYIDSSAHSVGSEPTTTTTSAATTTSTTVRTTTTTSPPQSAVFSDVTGDTPYAAEIGLLAACGVVTGYADGTFGPDDPVLRQQFAKMIALATNWDVTQVLWCPFSDIQSGLDTNDPCYPAAYIAACAARGVVTGETTSTFGPYHEVTRAQLITMVARASDLPSPPLGYQPPFGRFDPDHYPWAAKAAYAGLLDGFEGMGQDFDFWAPATRAEVCLLLSMLVDR
jgi:uncharacterized protein YkwD